MGAWQAGIDAMSGEGAGREWFEVFDDHGHLGGLVLRNEVHKRGLWHRSADVWVFGGDGSLLLQRRARGKDLFAGCWDYSVGEHLRPQESYVAGARRGLLEELGVVGCDLEAVGGLRRVRTQDPARNIDDCEMARSFIIVHEGEVHLDPAEVAEVRWMTPLAVAHWMAQEPADFTPWFIQAASELGLIPLPDD